MPVFCCAEVPELALLPKWAEGFAEEPEAFGGRIGGADGGGFDLASSVSRRMSWSTRSSRVGKVVHSPERRSARAWRDTFEGQLEGCACRAWWRVVEILFVPRAG